MDDQNLKDLEREQADNKLIGDAFQHLLDTYLSSRHRKKVDIVTKAKRSNYGIVAALYKALEGFHSKLWSSHKYDS